MRQNDDQLGAAAEVESQPLHVMTDASMERIKRILVEHATATHRLFARSGFKYEDIEPLDATLRAHIAALRGPSTAVTERALATSDRSLTSQPRARCSFRA